MRAVFTTLFIIILSSYLLSQKQANIWYFGGYGTSNSTAAGIDFNTYPPTSISSPAMHAVEGSASIADNNGQLLFYTDGISIWDKTHNMMPGGFGIGGGYSTTQTLIVPQPGNDSLYYVFAMGQGSVGFFPGDSALYYTVVNMKLNGGLGNVSTYKVQLMTPSTEKVTAVKHCNKKDFWIITHQWMTDAFYVYLLTANGLSGPFISNVGRVHDYITGPFIGSFPGEMKASHDGRKVAIVCGSSQSPHPQNLPSAELFDFDNATGVLSNPITLGKSGYGVEFSPDNTKLYISTSNHKIRQFDLLAGTDSASIVNSEIGITVTGRNANAMQLGPDGKIYCVKGYGTNDPYPLYVAAINNPNLPGLNCGYTDSSFALTVGTPGLGLPNFYRGIYDTSPPPPPLNIDFNYSASCIHDTISFSGISPGIIPDSWEWNFGDSLSTTDSTIFLQNPKHFFPSKGNYTVTLIAKKDCQSDTIVKTIAVGPPSISLQEDSIRICNGTDYIVSALSNGVSFFWQPGDLTTPSISVSNSGTYFVTVTSSNGCTAIDSIRVDTEDCFSKIYIPKAFSPNSDNLNDVFIPHTINMDTDNFQMTIFDRWGNIVFETSNLNTGWDGKVKNTLAPAQEDVYVYSIFINDKNENITKYYSGYVCLLK